MSDEITNFLSTYPPHVSTLAEALHTFLLKNLPGISEQLDSSAKIIGYGYGTGYKDMICAIILSRKGIKLGFNKGSELPDPKKLLTGSGKVHKYVEIKSDEDIKSKALKKLLQEAVKSYKLRISL
jgi:hypothetical protein